jgi:glycogen operon protein
MAEAWDAGGLYQVGSFSRDHWKEWNGRFRDDVRSFLRSSDGTIPPLQQRLLGSPDLYSKPSHPPEQSINFVTCHDGFTLNDLYSYNEKHNLANGEDNRDGMNDNLSWNCGVEGPTSDPSIENLRERQIRNAFALNMLSIGTPLLLMGDEVRRTQQGNNNAYCQNNGISWFDWTLCEKNSGLLRFVSRLIRLRRNFGSSFHLQSNSLQELLSHSQIEWHGVRLHSPDLTSSSHSIALTIYADEGHALHLMLSAYWEPLDFAIPPARASASPWHRILDTSLPSPQDITDSTEPIIPNSSYRLAPHTIALLCSHPDDASKPH